MVDKNATYQSFPIVGVAVSLEDTEVLEQFFSQVSAESFLAYIVVNTSPLPQVPFTPKILQRYTSVPVTFAQQDEVIRPKHIYLIPLQTKVSISYNKIQLQPISNEDILFPLDSFFQSLAHNKQTEAAGVILSGTGSDGIIGIKAIKFQEGLVLVQWETTASYQEMPRSAVLTGAFDAKLPPEQIPGTIEQYFQHKKTHPQPIEPASMETSQEWLKKISVILQLRVGHDFTPYKQNTLRRQIARRMTLKQIHQYEDYLQLLRETPEEVKALFRECLIGVTSLFRDPLAFQILQENVLPSLLHSLDEGETFRVWVPACSTGDEVYSLAIILQELIENMNKQIYLQLFGTDVDSLAIERAREGIFTANIQAEITPERLNRFFTQASHFYYVKPKIRNSIIFSVQDVLKDPPFSHIHLLSCRNLLIYLNPETQKQLLPLFHYTLNASGILMLGASESIGGFHNLFNPLDQRWKIFKRRDVQPLSRQKIQFPAASQLKLTATTDSEIPSYANNPETNLGRLVERKLLEEICPTAILIESNGIILHIQGRTGKFLEIVRGSPSNNIINLAREGLKFELSSAIRTAISSGQSVTRQQIKIRHNDPLELVNLQVQPLDDPPRLAGRLLVIFKIIAPDLRVEETQNNSSQQRGNYLAELEKELQDTRESHQTAIEELESSNEELQATNEALESSNEELQATNEELESSKEELQSVNEELHTLNQELQSVVDELSVTQDDLKNLLNFTDITTIIVDHQMRIKRFTPKVTEIIPLIPTDIGRPIQDVTINLKDEGMVADILEVSRNFNSKRKVVQTKEGYWYRMEIIPYWKENQQVEGTVIKFINVDELIKTQQFLLDANSLPAFLLNEAMEIVTTNQAYQKQITDQLLEEEIIRTVTSQLQPDESFQELSVDISTSEDICYNYLIRITRINTSETVKYMVLVLAEV